MSRSTGIKDLSEGLNRQALLEKSGIRRIFTPYEPISSIDLFFGRLDEVQRIINSILTPGQHAVLFGERGVGKSSLANVSSELLFKDLVGGKYVHHRCDSRTSFDGLAAKLPVRT
jgi:MoxR-like ATPase